MPSNLLNADTGFPDLMGNQSTDEKFRMVSDYLYMLLEQLRYSMANLGRENFNDTAFQEIAGLITEPVYIQLKDVEGNLSSLTVTAEQLISRMTDAEGNISVLQQTSTSLTSQVSDLEGNVSTLQQSSKALEVRLTNAEGDLSRITVTVNGITQSVSDLETGLSQTLRIAPNGVTITNASGDTLTIDGGQIDATNLNLTGMITFRDLADSVQNDINDAYSMAEDAQTVAADAADTVGGWTYRGTTYIDGTRIMTGTVSASTLEGGEIRLLDSRGYEAGTFTLDGSSSTSGQKVLLTSNAIELNAVNGDIYLGLYGGSAGYVQISDGEVTVGRCDLQPNLDNRYACGTNGHRWSAVYAASSSIITSDRNKKNSITYDMSAYDALFDRLRPTPYRYNEGTSGRTHTGLISQDVEEALATCGLTGKEFAGFVKETDKEGTDFYSLRYEEFISLCIDQIQKLKKKVRELEERV